MKLKVLPALVIVTSLLASCAAGAADVSPNSIAAYEEEISTSNEIQAPRVDEESILESCDPLTSSDGPSFELETRVDSSLPDAWAQEFEVILSNLQTIAPISHCIKPLDDKGFASPFQVFAWSSDVANPWPDERPDLSGACVCGDGVDAWMALEITADEFKYDSLHRYSVVAHEYFHLFQISVSSDKMGNGGLPMWLVEGGAKVFEELYVQEAYGRSEFDGGLFPVSYVVAESPGVLETYERDYELDINYNSAAFLVLALVDHLQQTKGISQERALGMVLFDILTQLQIDQDWEEAFQQVFEISVSDFYRSLEKYPVVKSPETWYEPDVVSALELLPSKDLELAAVFTQE